METPDNINDLIIIKTARNKDSINEAAKNGYKLIIKKVEPSSQIRSKYSVVQNINTGEIEVLGDLRVRLDYDDDPNFETIIDWTLYYPYNFESPFAAYLIPPDLEKGESVLVEDLIEDIVGSVWNQGDAYRLESCEAIWNGEDLIIQNNPEQGPWVMKG
jgi:hypothetical protein